MSENQIKPVDEVGRDLSPSDAGERPFWHRLPAESTRIARQRVLVVRGELRRRWRFYAFLTAAFIPTFLALIYYSFIAADRYISTTSFVVQAASKTNMLGGISSLLQMTGIARSSDDSYAVHEFIMSRDALKKLEQRIPLRDMFGRPEADMIAGYPSLLYGGSDEDLFDYYKHVVSLNYNGGSGISRIEIDLFRPEDSKLLAETLLQLSEELINGLNLKMQHDAVDFAEADVAEAQDRVVHSQALLTAFRNQSLTVDPEEGAKMVADLSARMSAELAALRARIAELESLTPDSPLLPQLRNRAAAIQEQLEKERQRVAGSGETAGVADQMAEYESLMLMHEFANEELGRSLATLELARGEARRQQLFLERVVEPNLPDVPGAPRSFRIVASVFGANLIFLLVAWFVIIGIREHSARNH